MRPTEQAYDELQRAFDHFNDELFEGSLPACIITLQRQQKFRGFYAPGRFINRKGEKVDEIALNPGYFATSSIEEILSTIVHEQAHQAEHHAGTGGRRGYHNESWAKRMEELGLEPTNTGQPGGKRTGQRVGHFIIEGGPFSLSCERLLTDDFMLSWMDRIPHPVHDISDRAIALGLDDEPASAADSEQSAEDDPTKEPDSETSSSSEEVSAEENEPDAGEPDGVPTQTDAHGDPFGEDAPEENSTTEKETTDEDTSEGPVDPVVEPTPVEDTTESRVEKLKAKGVEVEVVDPSQPKKKKNKSLREKYTCPECQLNIWGKPGLQVVCGSCSTNGEWVLFAAQ